MIQTPRCRCYFCRHGKSHPARHTSWFGVTHMLTQAESLDPKHSIKQEACSTCGHLRVVSDA